jgi:hypothetical protein
VVRVHCDKGVAIHIGPEPCAFTREGEGEASVGERAGQPLSRERSVVSGADDVQKAEGKTAGRANASVPTTRRGRRIWHARKRFAREPGDLLSGQPLCGLVRAGKARSRSR